ncbi:MAG TPA: hypothetical protein VGF79_04955 [Bacteroidia bacterium]
MGFNIAGAVFNKNFENHVEELSNILKIELEFVEIVDFESASENWKDENIFDVYFCETGTIVFGESNRFVDEIFVPDCKVLSFEMSEVTMAFWFNYTENGKLIRSFMEVEGNRLTDEGEPLPSEDPEDGSESIWNQIGVVLGKSFHEIDLEEKAHRYIVKGSNLEYEYDLSEEEIKSVISSVNLTNKNISGSQNRKASTEKKWWEFWK